MVLGWVEIAGDRVVSDPLGGLHWTSREGAQSLGAWKGRVESLVWNEACGTEGRHALGD